MRKILILFCFLITIKTFSQKIYNGKVTYAVSLNTSLKNSILKNNNKEVQKLLNDINKNAKTIDAELKFTNIESIYTITDKLDIKDDLSTKISKARAGGEKIYYYNNFSNEKIVQDCDLLGECFLINLDIVKWELHNYSKIINGYLCYYATYKVKKDKVYEISAWYTPKIPINFGPLTYSGLPGLILELTDGVTNFTAKQISLNLKILEIEKPTKGKKVTEKEFLQIAEKSMPKDLFKNE